MKIDKSGHFQGNPDEEILTELGFETQEEAAIWIDEFLDRMMKTIDIVEYNIDGGGEFQGSIFPMRHDNIDISAAYNQELERKFSIESKIASVSSETSFLLSEIKNSIYSEKSISHLVTIIELLLEKINFTFSDSKKFYDFKHRCYRLYGNRRTMLGRGKDGLPKVKIHENMYYLDTKFDIHSMRNLALRVYSYLEKQILSF